MYCDEFLHIISYLTVVTLDHESFIAVDVTDAAYYFNLLLFIITTTATTINICLRTNSRSISCAIHIVCTYISDESKQKICTTQAMLFTWQQNDLVSN